MSFWRQLKHGTRALFRPAATDRDIRDEVAQYIDAATAANIRDGLSPAAAQRVAMLDVGNETGAREQIREAGWERFVQRIATDTRLAVRRLSHSPGFTTVSVLTLALGIGATTAIFSAVKPILLDPLPYPNANRVVMISDFGEGGAPIDVTYGTYVELAARTRSFEAVAVANNWQPALISAGAAGGDPVRLGGQRVTASYFGVLGIAPAHGRDFTASEDRPGGPNVAIVSAPLARVRFGSEQAAVGASVLLDGDPYTIIGVMPRQFDNVVDPGAEIWAPLRYQANASFQTREWGHHLTMVARARPGVTITGVNRDIDAVARQRRAEYPRPSWADMKTGMIVTELQDAVSRDVRPALLAIVGAVVLLLSIACVNVTNLLLARAVQRRPEFAMRTALGGGRGRIVAQLLTESLVLAALGGSLGFVIAGVGVHTLVAISPAQLPRLDAIHLDGGVFLFALVLTASIGVLVALVPAWQASGDRLLTQLHESSRRVAGRQLTRSSLVVAEVALAAVLLVMAGLLLRSITQLFRLSPGFDTAHVATMQIDASGHQYDADSARYQFYQRSLEAVRLVPGVTTAALTSQLPLTGEFDSYGVEFATLPETNADAAPAALRYAVTADYFRTLHIPLKSGRLFDERDVRGAPEVVLLSESFARQMFGNRDPIGQQMRAGPEIGDSSRRWATVVGVVGDVKQQSLAMNQFDAFYVPMGQWPWVDQLQSIVVRTSVDPAAAIPAVRRAIWSVDREPIVRATTMEQLVASSEAQRHFALIIFEAFALAALALAGIGLYGILAGRVAERTREIGVRAALGASQGEIVRLVVRQGMALTAMGLAIGIGATFGATRAVASLLFGISRLDLATYLAVAVTLTAVAVAACCVPAWRAARVDPNIALRAE